MSGTERRPPPEAEDSGLEAGQEPGFRFERKFVSNRHDPGTLAQVVRCNRGLFREVYPPRQINNVYFDTPGLESFHATRAGTSGRSKLRLRWYGTLRGRGAVAAWLELKIRKSLMNRKERVEVAAAALDPFATSDLAAAAAGVARASPALASLCRERGPVLINRYSRRYFLSSDGRFRVTLDSAIEYFDLRGRSATSLYGSSDRNNVVNVLELKYPAEHAPRAPGITRDIPLRLSRNSKYCNGVIQLQACGLL